MTARYLLLVLPFALARLPAAPIPDQVKQTFSAMEGRHLGTAAYPMGRMSTEVVLGALKGVYESEGEAIQAARVSPGAEALKRAKGKDGVLTYAVFGLTEFDAAGKFFSIDTKGGRFAVVEEDKVAEERFRVRGDVRLAVYETNETTRSVWFQPDLRRYDSSSPVKTHLADLPLSLDGIAAVRLAEAKEWIAAQNAAAEKEEARRSAYRAAAEAESEAKTLSAGVTVPSSGRAGEPAVPVARGLPAGRGPAAPGAESPGRDGAVAQPAASGSRLSVAPRGDPTDDDVSRVEASLAEAERLSKALSLKLEEVEIEEAMAYDEQKPASFWAERSREEFRKSREHMRAGHWPIAVRRLRNARQYALYEERKSGQSAGKVRIERDLAAAEAQARREAEAASPAPPGK